MLTLASDEGTSAPESNAGDMLDARARNITESMKMAAARAIAACISDEELCAEYIIPGVFDSRVAEVVAKAVADEVRRSPET